MVQIKQTLSKHFLIWIVWWSKYTNCDNKLNVSCSKLMFTILKWLSKIRWSKITIELQYYCDRIMIVGDTFEIAYVCLIDCHCYFNLKGKIHRRLSKQTKKWIKTLTQNEKFLFWTVLGCENSSDIWHENKWYCYRHCHI